MVFGEIDCMEHIYKNKCTSKKSEKVIIDKPSKDILTLLIFETHGFCSNGIWPIIQWLCTLMVPKEKEII